MAKTFLIITSIASQDNPVLKEFAEKSASNDIPFIVIGDTKSPKEFNLIGCDFYSIDSQLSLDYGLAKTLPLKHYSRKNLGYLIAISKGAEIIIETDDDNLPYDNFWKPRTRFPNAHLIRNTDWVNVYRYFTKSQIWPRGFALENIQDQLPELEEIISLNCPIQQGLVDANPDVDAIYRLTMTLPLKFNIAENIALGINSFCPFNSQNTTWFKEAFLLLYLPSYCSFRMTDIWRSFVAQRIAWTCGWSVLFHQSTAWQQRNDHHLMSDFNDEIIGYQNNALIYKSFKKLNLTEGVENIAKNMITCYQQLIELGLIEKNELHLLKMWIQDINPII